MNRQILFIIVFLVVAVFLGWQYFWPALNEVALAREELATWQERLSDTQGLKKKLEDLTKRYETISEQAERVNQAITIKEDLPGLLVQFEELSSQNGLILDSIDFALPDAKEKKPANLPAGANRLRVSLSLSGDQKALVPFLRAVEDNLRIMDISAINFSLADVGLATQNFVIYLDVYYAD